VLSETAWRKECGTHQDAQRKAPYNVLGPTHRASVNFNGKESGGNGRAIGKGKGLEERVKGKEAGQFFRQQRTPKQVGPRGRGGNDKHDDVIPPA